MPNHVQFDFSAQFIKAYELLENTQNNIFVTGEAGTGKSTLLQYFKENTLKNVVLLAPTGVAALNIKGQTIHSFFGFKPDITTSNVDKIKLTKKKKKILKAIDAIIIDEVSMVRSDLLDCIDSLLKIYGRKTGMPFGGIQMIFFGDLYQLPPVVTRNDAEIFQSHYKSPYFFDAVSFKSLDLRYLELNVIYRQKDDDFIEILNAVRNNKLENKHLTALNRRFVYDFEPLEDELFIYLTTTNDMAEKINIEKLSSLKTREYRFTGITSGDFESKELPTPKELVIKFKSQVMLLNNDPQGRWINGTIGKVMGVTEEDDSAIVHVELSDGKRVEMLPFTWEMFRFSYNDDSKTIETETVGSFTQFPLKLAWAVTIHKSQGQTFSRVVLDVGRGTFVHGQLYVALSRCRSLPGLVLRKPIDKRHVILDEKIVSFVEDIKKTKSIQALSIS